MKFSYNELQKFFDTPLPPPELVADKITFHSSEIEEIISLPNDTVLDVKVLPDKSAWLMSHRGLAKELSVILGLPLKQDPFNVTVAKQSAGEISITRSAITCDFYAAAFIDGVKVGPSPKWLAEALEAVGQRSINNIVDATNYVMFELGQPLHAFDAKKLSCTDGIFNIEIRSAENEEEITTLTGESYKLSTADTVITDGATKQPLAIAGVKGGQFAALDENTTSILLESAHFERVAIRNTAKRLKLPTDASKRFENGICVAVAPIALARLIEVVLEVAGGDCTAVTHSGETEVLRHKVSCALTKINSVLGLNLDTTEVSTILDNFGYEYEWKGDEVSVTPAFERDDIILVEDLIEEIGRIHGFDKIVSIPPTITPLQEYNARHYYAEKIRTILTELGFSEIYTSSFRNKDIVKIENALASDKGYLRSSLTYNLKEATERNVPHRDLLGLQAIKLFEIGTVFNLDSEEFRVGLAVLTGTTYKAKTDDALFTEALSAIESELGIKVSLINKTDGVGEFSLDELLEQLPTPTHYESVAKLPVRKYQAFSVYPAMTRDIAMWVGEGVAVDLVMNTLKQAAGPLLVTLTLFDEFTKEGRTSYAFRLVFQSLEKTLTDEEVQVYMESVYKNVVNQGWEVR